MSHKKHLRIYRCNICKKFHKGKRYVGFGIRNPRPHGRGLYICPSCFSKIKKDKKSKQFMFLKRLAKSKYTTRNVIDIHEETFKDDEERLSKSFLTGICKMSKPEINSLMKEKFKGDT